MIVLFTAIVLNRRHKTRLHIGQLVKDTSEKLKQASEADRQFEVSVSLLPSQVVVCAVF